MLDIENYKVIIKSKLSEARYNHCINVANAAVDLAIKYNADINKARIAGLLHDITKEMPIEEQKKLINDFNFKLDPIEKMAPKLWHAISGAIYVENILDIKDEDIIKAIKHHTTAAKNMTKLEKIIYIADFISEERDYLGVQELRRLAYINLDLCVLEGLKFSLIDLSKRNLLIHQDTFEAYNQMILKVNNKEVIV